MRSIPLIVTNTGKRVMDLDVHYRQTLNQRIVNVGRSTNGWFAGGLIEFWGFQSDERSSSSIDRIIFANDVQMATSRGFLNGAKSRMAGTGNSTDSWIGGSQFGSTVDRINLQEDGVVALTRGPLSLARGELTAVGNVTDGWYAGGIRQITSDIYSTIDRITFSADLSVAGTRGSLVSARHGLSGTGNTTSGWLGGGFNNVQGMLSAITRITYSNDTVTTTNRTNMQQNRVFHSSTTDNINGWFIGGSTVINESNITSSVDRITFASDTTVAVVRGSLSSNLYGATTQANQSDGWIGGGAFQESISSTNIQRIIFSNDGLIAQVRGPLTVQRFKLSSP